MSSKRQDTRLEAEGAEFLVLAHLLLEGIPAYKTYTQMPGYDLVATSPEHGRSARIQVKSRWASDSDQGFPIKNTDADFVVFTLLNRGYRLKGSGDGKKTPELFVFPMSVVKKHRREDSWGKVMTRKIPDRESFRERWSLLKDFLQPEGTNL